MEDKRIYQKKGQERMNREKLNEQLFDVFLQRHCGRLKRKNFKNQKRSLKNTRWRIMSHPNDLRGESNELIKYMLLNVI